MGSLLQVLCSTVSSLESEAVASSVSSVLVMSGIGFVGSLLDRSIVVLYSSNRRWTSSSLSKATPLSWPPEGMTTMFGRVSDSLSNWRLLRLDLLGGDVSVSSWTAFLFWSTGVGSMLYLRPVLTIFDVGAGGKLSLRTGNREDEIRCRCVGESSGG